jgi:hypothetical protein
MGSSEYYGRNLQHGLKQAWKSLRSFYQPRNTLRATILLDNVTSNKCHRNSDVGNWLNEMQQSYNALCDVDPDSLSDAKFGLAILNNMPQDIEWRPFLSSLRATLLHNESQDPPLPVSSMEFITSIREEYWYRQKDLPHPPSYIFSARSDTDKRPPKRANQTTAAAADAPPTKRIRNPDKSCTNPHCGSPRGHEIKHCMAYGGGSQGKYAEWWSGPWNIHLPLEQRTSLNNKPPKSHPAYAKLASSTPKPTVYYAVNSPGTSRSDNASPPQTTDDDPHINSAVSNETPLSVVTSQPGSTPFVAELPILEQSMTRNDYCHYDCGANRHVFHDRSAFETYDTIQPLAIKGFGRNLLAVALGQGTVRLQCVFRARTSSILLTNVLHIPAARSNLISTNQLAKGGIVCTMGEKSATLFLNGLPLVSATTHNGMYHLNVTILRPAKPLPIPSLASRISPLVTTASDSSSLPDFCTT